MNHWLKKFRQSNALDQRAESARDTSPSVRANRSPRTAADQREWATDPDAFDDAIRRLDARLRMKRPADSPPPDLHSRIMRRVRAGARERDRAPSVSLPAGWGRWIAPAAICLALAGLWLILKPGLAPEPERAVGDATRSLNDATDAVESGMELVRRAPAITLASLELEFGRLRQDFRSATRTALASLPQTLPDDTARNTR